MAIGVAASPSILFPPMGELCRSPDAKDIVVLGFREHVRGEISRPRAEPTVRIVHRL